MIQADQPAELKRERVVADVDHLLASGETWWPSIVKAYTRYGRTDLPDGLYAAASAAKAACCDTPRTVAS